MILRNVQEAIDAGARQAKACRIVGFSAKTFQRWNAQGGGEDRRAGPHRAPANKLSDAERQKILKVANSVEYRDKSPKQIVPDLADRDLFLASESSFYRILHEEKQMTHRARAKPARGGRPKELVATAPCQVWSWDITYLKSPVRGLFYYLYMAVDVWSRKIVGWAIHEEESGEHASLLFESACHAEGVLKSQLTLHADNGGPMKGATLLGTLQRLGIATSFSRPRVSDDNPYSESLFRTLKYRPDFPEKPFESIEAANTWVARFVAWYNNEHRHSEIRYVTPSERHTGRDLAILANRERVYAKARKRHPERWTGKTRNWTPIEVVRLNPETKKMNERKIAN